MPDIYDRIVIRSWAYDLPAGIDRFRDRMKAYFPGEADAIDAYISAVEAAADASRLFFTEKALPRPISWLAGRFLRWRFLRYANRTTASVLGSLTGTAN